MTPLPILFQLFSLRVFWRPCLGTTWLSHGCGCSYTPLSVIPPIWFGKREEGERSMVYPWAAARVLQLLAYVHTYASYAGVAVG